MAWKQEPADKMDEAELQLKRLETVFKSFDAATERQFKLASFALAGNVGAVAASSLALKDFREKDMPLGTNYSDAMFWFFLGAILATICLGIVLIASEVISYIILSVVAKGPTKDATQGEMFDKMSSAPSNSVGLIIFVVLYGMSGWCFFFGLYKVLTLVH